MTEPKDRETEANATKAWTAWSAEFLLNLFDLEFRILLTPRVMPVIYALAIVASGVAVAAYALEGFSLSAGQGLVRLLLSPLAFLVLVTTARIALEFCLVVFRIAVHVNKMAGHTEDLAGGLPLIQFWKPFRRRGAGDE
jgi:uncharacterized membrane protein